MKLVEAQNIIDQIANKPFGTLITDEKEFSDIVKNKGKAGQILERIILHLKLSTTLHDFEDGELKTNKCDHDGKPLETIAITQISGIIDDLIDSSSFETSRLAQKIKNFLYVPIVREGDSHNWFFMDSIHIDFTQPKYANIWEQLEKDYYTICEKIANDITINRAISTSNGKYIQIRTKDSIPYNPIFSKKFNTYVSNKNYAFYFKKEFINAIRDLNN